VDDYSRTTWTHLLATKSNAVHLIKAFIEMAFTQFHARVQTIRSDNALELGLSKDIAAYFLSKGIIHQTSCVGTSQQNGVVERKHKHLLETSRALLFHSGLPIKFWGDCVLTATYLINRFPCKILKGLTPYQLLFGQSPSYDHLKVFSSLCYASTIKANRDKFQPRAIPCIFLGYPFGQKAYKLLNLDTHQVFTSRDVIFHEHILPYSQQATGSQSQLFPPFFPSFLSSNIHILEQSFTPVHTIDIPVHLTPSIAQDSSQTSAPTEPQHHPSSSSTQPDTRRSTRGHKTPSYLSDYVCNNITTHTKDDHSSACPNTITAVCCNVTAVPDQVSLPPASLNLLQNLAIYTEPSSYAEAASQPEWQEAMQKEFDTLHSNNTWELVELPRETRPISCKWVYKVKYKADGSVERCKA